MQVRSLLLRSSENPLLERFPLDVEHLTLLVGKESVALGLIRHFGSLKALARASFQELRQFLPRRKAECCLEYVRYSRNRARPF